MLLIHLPGGVDYRTNIQTFTVSKGEAVQGKRLWASILEPPASFLHHHGPVCVLRWQETCWRSCVGRWA
jgi:hypothetical protein